MYKYINFCSVFEGLKDLTRGNKCFVALIYIYIYVYVLYI